LQTVPDETAQRFIVGHRSVLLKDSAEIAMMTTISQCLNPGSSQVPKTINQFSEPFYEYAFICWIHHAKEFAGSLDPKREVGDVLSDLCVKWNLPHPYLNLNPSNHDQGGCSPQASSDPRQACPFVIQLADTPSLLFLWFLHTPTPAHKASVMMEAIQLLQP